MDFGSSQASPHVAQAHGQLREATEVGQTCAHCNARVSSKSGYNVASFAISELDLVILVVAMSYTVSLINIYWIFFGYLYIYIDKY